MSITTLTPKKIRFFRRLLHGQSYLNLLYLLASFPLGVFYFVFLVSGIATGLSLVIVWLGVPILLLVGAACWVLASFERSMVIHMLKEKIPPMSLLSDQREGIWMRLKKHLVNPVTWKSLFYLFLKFPLGMATFVVLITFLSLTLAFLSMPFTFQAVKFFPDGLFINFGLPVWHIDSLGDALLGMLIGLLLWPLTLYVTDGLAWVHAKAARFMLSDHPLTA